MEYSEIHGCGDGNCIWRIPTGMHTNGGCKCLSETERALLEGKEAHETKVWRMVIRSLKQRISAMRDEISRLSSTSH